MARGKASFVLYADYIGLVSHLPDDLAGKLFKLILDYVNDKNPEPEDLTLRIAFEPIMRQLKRDLKKYEKTKTRRSATGKLGGIKSGEARRSKTNQNEANEAIGSNSKQNEPIGSTLKQNEANEADNVNDNVTVNDTVTDNVIKTKSFVLSFPHGSEEFLGLWGDWVEYRAAIKKPYATFSSQQVELQVLGGYPEKTAIEIIQTALKNGWKNLRPPLDVVSSKEPVILKKQFPE